MDKAKLFEQLMPQGEFEVPGFGVLTIRGISRYEQLMIGKTAQNDVLAFERKMLALAIVAPELSEDEVGQWQKVAPAGQMSGLMNKVNELSGLNKDIKQAQKEAYESFRDEPGA